MSLHTMSIRALRSARLAPAYHTLRRNASTTSAAEKDLKETLKEVIPAKREMLKKLRAEHGQKSLGEVKVENVIGGMRFIPSPLLSSCPYHC